MKLAIIKLSAMGDIIHAMVALQYIKKHNKNIVIDWFVEEAFSQILENNQDINNIYKINLKAIKKEKIKIFDQITLIKKYSKNSYDLVIDAQGLFKSAVVAKLLGKNIAGFDKDSIREPIASFFYKKKINIAYSENAILRNAKILSSPLNFEISKEDILNKKAFLFYKNEDKIIYEYLKENKKNIILVIGASWDSKMYSKEKFVKIVNKLDENCMILWGSSLEKEIALYISSNSSAIVLPKLNLNSVKALISKADLLIGNDTGPTHMAWALNVTSITLFGNTPGYRNTYITNKNRILESSSKVNALKLNKNDFSIKDINESEIITLAKELLYE